MSAHERLKNLLTDVHSRQLRLQLWSRLAWSWAAMALVGLMALAVERQTGWGTWLAAPLLLGLTIFTGLFVLIRHAKTRLDLRQLAHAIELQFPQLEGRLLTAVQQTPSGNAEL